MEVIDGSKDDGKQGIVKAVERASNQVVVEGVNLKTKHVRGDLQRKGGIIKIPHRISVAAVHLVDPTTGLGSKIRTTVDPVTKKKNLRVTRDTDTVIPRPEFKRKKPKVTEIGSKDTKPEDVLKVTYTGEVFPPSQIGRIQVRNIF